MDQESFDNGSFNNNNRDQQEKFEKLNSLVMEHIPEKYQTRQNKVVFDTSQNLKKYANYLKGAAKNMNLDSIDANKKGGVGGRSLRVSLHSSIDLEDGSP